jgi:hypothetical protein
MPLVTGKGIAMEKTQGKIWMTRNEDEEGRLVPALTLNFTSLVDHDAARNAVEMALDSLRVRYGTKHRISGVVRTIREEYL